MMTETLKSKVEIARQYQRSIRIETDLGRMDSLNGYICHNTARMVLDNISRQVAESKQQAFTLTGPFGGGKSSLAICFASTLVSDDLIRNYARTRLKVDSIQHFDNAFPVHNGWKILPISGRRTSVIVEIAKALNASCGRIIVDEEHVTSSELINALITESKSNAPDGLLLIIDEMGKFLEFSAMGGDDIHFFQDLAECANRVDSKLIVIGILHQAFRQYAHKLNSGVRDDWAKIQGRFSDIALITTTDEVVDLLANAINSEIDHSWTKVPSQIIGKAIQKKRPSFGNDFPAKLDACWPLHPAMAALLGPISKRQFGQNERSTFGFLTSSEPYAFQAFLDKTDATTKAWYRPADYWDFLKANLEAAIHRSSDSHRWTQASISVEAIEAQGNLLKISLIKNIAILDMFRSGSSLAASTEVLCALHADIEPLQIEQALDEISVSRAAVYRKYLDAWVIYDGSDFDIEAALLKAKSEIGSFSIKLLEKTAGLYPVVAKRHYHSTGTMRWMNVKFMDFDEIESLAEDVAGEGSFGQFVLVIPFARIDENILKAQLAKASKTIKHNTILGITHNYLKILDLASDIEALRLVEETNHMLATDSVARRELAGRISDTRSALESELQIAITSSLWLIDGTWRKQASLAQYTSELADQIFNQAPIIKSELVNRDALSANAVKARKDLVHRLVLQEDKENLGLKGWPAERGLYQTILNQSNLHGLSSDGEFKVLVPQSADNSFYRLWDETDKLFSEDNQIVSVSSIYSLWSKPPFGLKQGIVPIILIAYLRSRHEQLAVYKEDIFQTNFDDETVDELLLDPFQFTLRKVSLNAAKQEILNGVASILAEAGFPILSNEPLETARGLVSFFDKLPEWTRRTKTLTEKTSLVRDILIKARDPHKLLFVDLPTVLQTKDSEQYLKELTAPLKELAQAYPTMIQSVEKQFLESIDANLGDPEELRARAKLVHGITGDMRLDSLAVNLQKHDYSIQSIEVILGITLNKASKTWSDSDIDEARFKLANWATQFRQAEALASVKNRKPTREAFAVVMGSGSDARTVAKIFDVADRDKEAVSKLTNKILETLDSHYLSSEVVLAALAEAGIQIANKIEDHK
ncbi:ATP-binding protein [Methylophilus sp. YYY-1]|uniref:ATP-binding protein n=1 Tax=Methylophilus sp. YYY-1 TaxID=2682087 RepID=UPI0023B2532F|nr:ATP-binding protein [Methylophilus sp. YYY-1]MDF0379002.1 ATP-binding protein [Methylophilus sp. YYY-1]